MVPESTDEMEKSARWYAAKEIEGSRSSGISNLLKYGDLDETNIISYLSALILSKCLKPLCIVCKEMIFKYIVTLVVFHGLASSRVRFNCNARQPW